MFPGPAKSEIATSACSPVRVVCASYACVVTGIGERVGVGTGAGG